MDGGGGRGRNLARLILDLRKFKIGWPVPTTTTTTTSRALAVVVWSLYSVTSLVTRNKCFKEIKREKKILSSSAEVGKIPTVSHCNNNNIKIVRWKVVDETVSSCSSSSSTENFGCNCRCRNKNAVASSVGGSGGLFFRLDLTESTASNVRAASQWSLFVLFFFLVVTREGRDRRKGIFPCCCCSCFWWWSWLSFLSSRFSPTSSSRGLLIPPSLPDSVYLVRVITHHLSNARVITATGIARPSTDSYFGRLSYTNSTARAYLFESVFVLFSEKIWVTISSFHRSVPSAAAAAVHLLMAWRKTNNNKMPHFMIIVVETAVPSVSLLQSRLYTVCPI